MNPSTIARHVANCEWPDVQSQKKIADGVFWFTSAGHGGCVALLNRFGEDEQKALRTAGKTQVVMINPAGKRCWYGGRFDFQQSFYEPQGYTFVEVVVGEEDCDWACIFLADTSLIEKANVALGGHPWTVKDVAQCCYRWNPAFAAELGWVDDPD